MMELLCREDEQEDGALEVIVEDEECKDESEYFGSGKLA